MASIDCGPPLEWDVVASVVSSCIGDGKTDHVRMCDVEQSSRDYDAPPLGVIPMSWEPPAGLDQHQHVAVIDTCVDTFLRVGDISSALECLIYTSESARVYCIQNSLTRCIRESNLEHVTALIHAVSNLRLAWPVAEAYAVCASATKLDNLDVTDVLTARRSHYAVAIAVNVALASTPGGIIATLIDNAHALEWITADLMISALHSKTLDDVPGVQEAWCKFVASIVETCPTTTLRCMFGQSDGMKDTIPSGDVAQAAMTTAVRMCEAWVAMDQAHVAHRTLAECVVRLSKPHIPDTKVLEQQLAQNTSTGATSTKPSVATRQARGKRGKRLRRPTAKPKRPLGVK